MNVKRLVHNQLRLIYEEPNTSPSLVGDLPICKMMIENLLDD